MSKFESRTSVLVVAIGVLYAPLSAQPRIEDLGAKQPIAFQAVNDAFRPSPNAAYAVNGLDHSFTLSRTGDLELRLSALGSMRALGIQILGARPVPVISAEDRLPGSAFEYIGNDRNKWKDDIPLYGRIVYRDVYPGIDLVWHGKNQQMEFDFIVRSGSDPSSIRLLVNGRGDMQQNASGELVFASSDARISVGKPIAHQVVRGERRLVSAGYRILNTTSDSEGMREVGLDLGPYDPTAAVVIDPVIDWTVYPKPPGLIGDDSAGKAVAVSTDGNIWVTGWRWYDTVSGSYQHLGYLARMTPDGTILQRGSFGGVNCQLVGNPFGNEAYGMVADGSGGVWIVGWTSCDDFPTVNPQQGSRAGNRDAFVTRWSSSVTLDYSSYLGGGNEEIAYGVGRDAASGSVWVAGRSGSSNFPLVGWCCGYGGGMYDAFVSRYTNSGSLSFSRLLGGNSDDVGYNVSVDSYGNAYVVGMTSSSNFLLANPTQSFYRGASDAFVTKLDGAGNVSFSTFLGGSGLDTAFAVDVDASQNIWVGGRTGSTNFPLQNSFLPYRGGPSDAFVSKYRFDGSVYTYDFGTYLGGSDNEVVYGLGIDPWGSVWISGQTFSYNWPVTADAFQSTRPGAYAGFLSRIDYFGWYSYGFGSYFPEGSSAGYQAGRLTIDGNGVVYITGDRVGYDKGMWLTKVLP